ncbi:hypothetical protein BD769DRAFT_1391490 [Suillus cothurnatus]|nr:hypothetical protein BD769DRAFT_1391490 [Suillus cothurnatus]
MTVVSNDPSWWPSIYGSFIGSYFVVAASFGVMYDWVLTFGQEVELIWHTVGLPTISMTDAVCLIIYDTVNWMGNIGNVILDVIMIARLHAMYQQSRKVLIFLVVVFLAIRIASVAILAMLTMQFSGVPEEYILSGTYQCITGYAGNFIFLVSMDWIIATIWEVLVLCLAVWIAIKHFHELRRHSIGGIIGDCFTVLMKTHDIYSVDTQIYIGLTQIFQIVQMFVLGPRLILGVREYHAKLVANSDTATAMTSIAFQERVHVSTSSIILRDFLVNLLWIVAGAGDG